MATATNTATIAALTEHLISGSSVAQLRKLGAQSGVKGASRMNRESLVTALTALIPPAAPAKPAKAKAAPKPEATPLDKAQTKATAFSKDVAESGWATTESKTSTGHGVQVKATRGAETIIIEWEGPVFIYGPCTYTRGDAKPVRLRNASQARQVAATPAK